MEAGQIRLRVVAPSPSMIGSRRIPENPRDFARVLVFGMMGISFARRFVSRASMILRFPEYALQLDCATAPY